MRRIAVVAVVAAFFVAIVLSVAYDASVPSGGIGTPPTVASPAP